MGPLFQSRASRREYVNPAAKLKPNTTHWLSSRWPLVLRFSKGSGSIHSEVLGPIIIWSAWAALVAYGSSIYKTDINIPASLVPSLSIVVGLELVFRNQTAYNRFWTGRLHFNTVTTAVRNLTRSILSQVPAPSSSPSSNISILEAPDAGTGAETLSEYHEAKAIETVKVLVAMMYAVKDRLRTQSTSSHSSDPDYGMTEDADNSEYTDLLPTGLKNNKGLGLGLTLQLATFVDRFINTGLKQNWFSAPSSVQMFAQMNGFVDAYGNMEVISLAPTPVAHLIHSKQTLALFSLILPFAMVSQMSWWCIPLSGFVTFTLYGIEAIALWHEDPFGHDKIDINMDEIVEDARKEVFVLLNAWQNQRQVGEALFSD